ncbi:hypothetical protein IWQ61_007955 [Dispira simplex]|nr:hypothetical protein IWQ61_007955 [Dispira simplex]
MANIVIYGWNFAPVMTTHCYDHHWKFSTKFPDKSALEHTTSVDYFDYHYFQINNDMYSAVLNLFWDGSASSFRSAMENNTPLVDEAIFRWAFQCLVVSANQRYCTITREAHAMGISGENPTVYERPGKN